MLSHKTSLKKFKKSEIISILFSNYKGVKLDINNNKKKTEKLKNTEMNVGNEATCPLTISGSKKIKFLNFENLNFGNF